MRAIQGIFLGWQKFNRTPAFAQRVLFAAEPRVDQAQNTKSRSPFRLLPDSFLLDGARSGEPRAGFVLVLGHTSDHTLDHSGRQSHRISANSVVSQCPQGTLSAGRVPLGQRADHPRVGHTFDCFWICRSDFFDCVAQRPRIRLRIERNQRSRYPGIDIIWFNCQRTIKNHRFVGIAPQIQIAQRDLRQREKVARIELDCPLQIAQSLFLITAPACDVARQLENTRIIRQCSARNLELRQRSIVIEIASIQMFGPRKMCFAAVGSKFERSVNR